MHSAQISEYPDQSTTPQNFISDPLTHSQITSKQPVVQEEQKQPPPQLQEHRSEEEPMTPLPFNQTVEFRTKSTTKGRRARKPRYDHDASQEIEESLISDDMGDNDLDSSLVSTQKASHTEKKVVKEMLVPDTNNYAAGICGKQDKQYQTCTLMDLRNPLATPQTEDNDVQSMLLYSYI